MKIKRVHLGEIIFAKVQEKGMSQARFADLIGLQRQNVKKTVFEKESLDTNLLCAISEVLECNFFNYYRCNNEDYKQEIKATLSIEMGTERHDRTLKFIFGDNNIEIRQ